MIQEAIEYLFGRGEAIERARRPAANIVDSDSGQLWLAGSSPQEIEKTLALNSPERDAVLLTTLPALLDFAGSCVEKAGAGYNFALPGFVVAPGCVVLAGGWHESERRSEIAAVRHTADLFPLDRFMPAEEFCLMLRARAEDTHARGELLEQLAKVGIHKTSGVTRLASVVSMSIEVGEAERAVELPNVASLKMRRTFPEVDQPQGDYVLRAKISDDQPVFSLVDAGGGTWEHQACIALREYLAQELASRDLALAIW
ncbi:MAG: hypothetical protein GY719_26090 [bacterium]|nr:hypothetical protein [bacterium]